MSVSMPAPDLSEAQAFMRQALEQAGRGMWHAAPNPCVGAVLAQGGRVVAQGWHTACGKPHAEVEALCDARQKGVDPASCTLYVTLEPCNHHGKTPPCTKAILEAGVPEVVVGCLDPNPDVAGGGVAALRQAGVRVTVGVLEPECRDRIADFLIWKGQSRPYVFLKLAATLDGRIATREGHSRWISGSESRARVHELRSRVQAVLVGGETLRQDDPQLTCRQQRGGDLAAQERQPLAVVLTSQLPQTGDQAPCLVAQRAGQTIFLTGREQAASPEAQALRDCGCRVWGLSPAPGGGLDLTEGLRALYSEGNCHYVLCEGGGGLGLSLLEAGLADEFLLFLAPKVLGDAQARPLFQGRSPMRMDEALGLRLTGLEQTGDDVLLTLRPQSPLRKDEDMRKKATCSPD